MVTIKQIAEMLGVSSATVSNVIHGKTNKVSKETVERVVEALKNTGYVQRMGFSSLNNGESKMIGVVIHNNESYTNTVLSDPFYGHLVGVLEEILRQKGYYILFCAAQNIDDIYSMAMGWNVDGLIAITFGYTEYTKLRSLTQKPIVSIDLHEYGDNTDFVNIGLDDVQGGYIMTKYLIRSGFTNILVLGHKNIGTNYSRWLGYSQALQEANLIPDKNNFFNLEESEEKSEKQMKYLARHCAQTQDLALFFLSDKLAANAVHIFLNAGLTIPQDVTIVGYDDNIYSQIISPRLTTINQNVKDKAKTAVDILLKIIAHNNIEEQNILLPVRLVVRDTVKHKKTLY